MELIVPYYKEYINIVASFIEELGICYGADNSERMKFRLLGEESFAFILSGIPSKEFNELFSLRCIEGENGLYFHFSNHGIPMNIRDIPQFSVEDITATADGLSLSLVQSLSDELSFRNLGRDGWELMVFKSVKNFKNISGNNNPNTSVNLVISQDITIRESTIQDVTGIINLAYNTYRYSYVKTLFYDKERLNEAISSGKVASWVAVTNKGHVIGHSAFMFDTPKLSEVGMAMIDPDYRRSRTFFIMVRAMKDKYKTSNPEVLYYSKCVTSHKASQAFASDFTPCYLQLSVYSQASFIGIENHSNSRESLIIAIGVLPGFPKGGSTFIPFEHYEVISNIFSNCGINIDLKKNSGNYSFAETQLLVDVDPGKQHAVVTLIQIGEDFNKILLQQTKSLQQEGVITVELYLPTNQFQSDKAESVLSKNGYFFCGIKPNQQDGWFVAYTNLLHQKFDFDNLQLFSPKSVELCQYIKNQYLALA